MRDEAAAAKAAEDKATAEREANIAHKKKVNNEILVALEKIIDDNPPDDDGSTSRATKAIITAIAKGEIPHVKITY